MTEIMLQSPSWETSDLFADIPSSVRMDIVSMARSRDYACREVMYLIGDPIRETLLLTDGCAKITQVGESGTEVILRMAALGEVIGELGVVPNYLYTSTAQAVKACKVLVWGAGTFEAALDRFPTLRRNANRIVQGRIAELEKRFCEVSTQMASPRLANALLRLIDQEVHKKNSLVEINVSQEELAQMTAMTSFNVNRLLNDWERQGVLRIRRQAIEIHSVLQIFDLCKIFR